MHALSVLTAPDEHIPYIIQSLDFDVVLMTEADYPGPEAQIETNDTL